MPDLVVQELYLLLVLPRGPILVTDNLLKGLLVLKKLSPVRFALLQSSLQVLELLTVSLLHLWLGFNHFFVDFGDLDAECQQSEVTVKKLSDDLAGSIDQEQVHKVGVCCSREVADCSSLAFVRKALSHSELVDLLGCQDVPLLVLRDACNVEFQAPVLVEEAYPLNLVPRCHLILTQAEDLKELNQGDVVPDIEFEPGVVADSVFYLEAEKLLVVKLDDEVVDVWERLALALLQDPLEVILLLVSIVFRNDPVDGLLFEVHLLDRGCKLACTTLQERLIHAVLVPKNWNRLCLRPVVRPVKLHVLSLSILLLLLELCLQLGVDPLTLCIAHLHLLLIRAHLMVSSPLLRRLELVLIIVSAEAVRRQSFFGALRLVICSLLRVAARFKLLLHS